MSFNQSTRSSPEKSESDERSPRNSDAELRSGQARDVRELVGLMTSSQKIEANRNNAKKSTGPRTPRGKSQARGNTLKHGAFAGKRLIQGEDEKEYRRLSARVFTETTPKTAIECMLADQIVGDLWRLKRVEQAERAYFEQTRAAALAHALRKLSTEECRLVPKILEGAKSSVGDSAEALSRSVKQKVHAAADPDKLMLDAMVSPDRAFPYSTLEHIRRTLVRDILRKDASLARLQSDKLTIEPHQLSLSDRALEADNYAVYCSLNRAGLLRKRRK